MRTSVIGTAFALLFSAAWAQQPAAQSQPQATKMFASAADVAALIARAKSERKPNQANFVQSIIQLAPYNVTLESRVGGVSTNPSVHERDAELFYVVDGSGTLVTGGTLRDEKRTNAHNLQGSSIEGGTSQHLGKGDFVMVPEKTPHWFSQVDGTLVLMSLKLPRAGSTSATP